MTLLTPVEIEQCRQGRLDKLIALCDTAVAYWAEQAETASIRVENAELRSMLSLSRQIERQR